MFCWWPQTMAKHRWNIARNTSYCNG